MDDVADAEESARQPVVEDARVDAEKGHSRVGRADQREHVGEDGREK